MITEIPVFPAVTYTAAQGQIGTRKWVLDQIDNIDQFLYVVSDSHWPGRRDCIPISIQHGPYECAVTRRDPDTNKRSRQTLGNLPTFGKHLVVAQYALHRMNNCWPSQFGDKPYHPPGTTLNLDVKTSGQYLLIHPPGVNTSNPTQALCRRDEDGVSPGIFSRHCVRMTEYHIVCDRLTKKQLNCIFTRKHWDKLAGGVNAPGESSEGFLNAPGGTLLFDGYTLNESFAAHSYSPLRYRLTAVFKKRIILKNCPGDPAEYVECEEDLLLDDSDRAVGWNHDYANVNKDGKLWDWVFIQIYQGSDCVPRYAYKDFSTMFHDVEPEYVDPTLPACDDESETPEELDDCAFTCKPSVPYTPPDDTCAEVE